MFNKYKEIFLQPYTSWKNMKSRYSILVNKVEVGSIVEMKAHKLNFINLFNTYFGLVHYNSLNLQIRDEEDHVVGYIRKETGFFKKKDFYLFTNKKELIATIKTNSTLTTTRIVIIQNQKETIHCEIKATAIDFLVIDPTSGDTVTTIRRRSPIYETVQENIEKGIDGYYIKTSEGFNDTLVRIFLGVTIDFYSR